LNFVNLDKPIKKKRGYSTHDTIGLLTSEEVVGTKTAAALESDFLARFNKSQPQGRPEGGLTIEEMAIAAKVGHASIRRWLAKQKGYKAILGTKRYATRKQAVTYYVNK
jgi:hypothetical protein